jgi:hypothetical protein
MQRRHPFRILPETHFRSPDSSLVQPACLFDPAISQKHPTDANAFGLNQEMLDRPDAVDRKLQAVFVASRTPHLPVDEFDTGADATAEVNLPHDGESPNGCQSTNSAFDQALGPRTHLVDQGANCLLAKESLDRTVQPVSCPRHPLISIGQPIEVFDELDD